MKPSNYILNLNFEHIRKSIHDLDLKYNGNVVVSFDVTQFTNEILFNSKSNINIVKYSVLCGPSDSPKKREISVKKLKIIPESNQGKILLGEYIGSTLLRQCNMIIKFNAGLKENMAGAYLSLYDSEDLKRKEYMVTTQFESMDARKAFPCMDEPDKKATFDITVTVPKGYQALSNADPVNPEQQHLSKDKCEGVAKRDNNTSHTEWKFKPTPKMSTYLVAFIVHKDFWYTLGYARRGKLPVRVWAQDYKVCQGFADWALEVAIKVIDYFEDWYGIPYVMDNVDIIAVPDFASGAMENWGLITFREATLLHLDSMHSAHHKQYCAMVVAHELAHQWFGNLVTMDWWDDLWLNEGFATFMEYKAVDALYPEWNMWGQFLSSEENRAMTFDGMRNSHPITNIVRTESDVVQMFDAISYQKGASLIRFLHSFMGECFFQKGIRRYLKDNSFGNAKHGDLWDALSNALTSSDDICTVDYEIDQSKKMYSISTFMEGWITQSNYPLIVLDSSRKAVESVVTFFTEGDGDFSTKRWSLPFLYYFIQQDGNIKKELSWVDMNQLGESSKIEFEHKILKANYDSSGFYRVCYPSFYWKSLKESFMNGEASYFTAADRAGLVLDIFALAKSGDCGITYEIALEFITFLSNEDDFTVWNAALPSLASPASSLSPPYRAKLKQLVISLMGKTPIFNINEETIKNNGRRSPIDPFPETDKNHHVNTLLLASIIEYCASLDENINGFNVNHELRVSFRKYVDNGEMPNPNIFETVLLAGIESGTKKDWEAIWQKFKLEKDATRKNIFLRALCSTVDRDTIQELLYWALDPSQVKPQDSLTVYARLAHGENSVIVWNFFEENFNELYELYKDMKSFGDVFKLLAGTLKAADTAKLENFISKHEKQLKQYSLAVEQGKEKLYSKLKVPRYQSPHKIELFLDFYDRFLDKSEGTKRINVPKSFQTVDNSEGRKYKFNIINIASKAVKNEE